MSRDVSPKQRIELIDNLPDNSPKENREIAYYSPRYEISNCDKSFFLDF